MPSSRLWPYPLQPGTHVIAKVRNLALTDDVEIVGTIARVLRAAVSMGTCTYAVKTKDGVMIQTLASRTVPIDTTTTEGLDQWLDRLAQDDNLDGLPTANEAELLLSEGQVRSDYLNFQQQAFPTTTSGIQIYRSNGINTTTNHTDTWWVPRTTS